MNFKKVLISGILLCSISLFAGCQGEQDIISNAPNTKNTRFLTTNSSYAINGDDYYIIIDNETNNIYLSAKKSYGNDTFPLLDKDGKPVKYNDLKK